MEHYTKPGIKSEFWSTSTSLIRVPGKSYLQDGQRGPNVRGVLWWHKPNDRKGKREYERFLRQNGFSKEWVSKLDVKREKMISENQGLVISVASKWAGAGIDFLDLVQEGNIGMLLAVDKYDPHRPSKFSTMAVPWIRKRIREAVMQKHLVHIPFSQQISESKRLRLNRKEHARTGEELQDALYQYQPEKQKQRSLPCLQTPKYIFDLQEGEPALTYCEDIDDRIDDQKNMARLYDVFWRLPKRERLILDKRLNLLDEKENQLKKELEGEEKLVSDMTKQRFFQLYHKTRRKIAAVIQNGGISPAFSLA